MPAVDPRSAGDVDEVQQWLHFDKVHLGTLQSGLFPNGSTELFPMLMSML